MAIVVQCPNPACRVSCSVADAAGGSPVRCARCGKPFVVKPSLDGQKLDTTNSQPSSKANPFPVLPAEFGRYRVLQLLGQGGMGAVYLAEDFRLGRQVALKMPFFEASESPQKLERFVREARSAAVLHHANICKVFDAGQINGRPFITMAYIAGKPLADEIDPETPMPQGRAAEIARKIALALEHAHGKGTVHRDLKPANVMMTAEGEPVVMDFGLAKRVAEGNPGEAKLTREGGIVGTPSYMSPEQVKGEVQAIGPATDVYSLGVMLFEMLTGKTPYTGSMGVVLGQILAAPAPPVKEFRPDVDSRLDAICRKAMAKEPTARFPSMMEFANALDQYLKAPKSSPPLSVPPVTAVLNAPAPVADRFPSGRPVKATPDPLVSKKAKRRRAGVVAVTLALLLGLVGLWSAGLFKVKTRDGTIVLENLPDGAEVLVDGEKIRVSAPGDNKPVEIQAAPGLHKLRISKDGFVAVTRDVELKIGKSEPIRVRLEPLTKTVKDVSATVPADVLRRADIPVAVLASIGGGDPKQAPPDLIAVLGDGRFRITAGSRFPAFSPDGALLAVPSGSEVFLFDANSGQLLRRFPGRAGRVWSVAFSPNGAVLAMGDDKIVRLWNPRTGVLLRDLSGHAWGAITEVAFVQDSQTVLSCSLDKTVRVWDVTTGRQGRVLPCKAEVHSIAITPEGRLAVAATHDGRFYGWSLDTGAEKFVVEVEEPVWAALSVSANGQWLASGTNAKLKVWKIADLAKKNPSPFFEKQTPAGWLQFEKKSNRLWTAEHNDHTTSNRACCWDPVSGQLVSSVILRGADSPWMVYALSPDGRTMAAFGMDFRLVKLFDTRTGKPRFPDPGHAREVGGVAFSPDGRWLASGSFDNTVRIWDLATGKERHKLEGHTALVWSVAFSPDSKLVAAGSHDGTIILWDPAAGVPVRRLNGYFRESSIRFSSDGKFVAAGTGDGGVRMWSARNGEQARMLRGLHEGLVRCLAFSADGQRLATGGDDGKLVIADLAGGKVLQSFQRNTGVYTVEFGVDGETVAAGYRSPEPVVRLWNLQDKDFVVLKGHTDTVNTLSLRSDGHLAVTSSNDGSVRLWEIGGTLPRKMVLGLGSVGEKLWRGALSPDGRYVATGNSNGTIYLLRLPGPAENVAKWLVAKGIPPRGLTHNEWLKRVEGLYVGNVLDAVSDRLCELNPSFDGKIGYKVEGGQIVSLEFLTINVKDISPVRALPGLRHLVCRGSWWARNGQLANLMPLKGMKLTTLNCLDTQVADLSPLEGMPLTSLECGNTNVASLLPLKGMPLTNLNIFVTQVKDLSPLKDMKLLRLNCYRTPVTDLSPLKGMKLTFLYCHATKVTDLSPLKGMPFTDLAINALESDRDATIRFLRSLTTLQRINEKPATQFWKEVENGSNGW